ncbi:Bifunctional cytochrome P450/NADPH--P450 reductase [Cercospora zeina]
MTRHTMTSKIPQPRTLPVVGNLFDLDPVNGTQSVGRLADKYGEIFKLKILHFEFYVVSSAALVAELCDETRFEKKIDDALEEVRNAAKDGLFTAHNDEPNWAAAHRALTPAFGPLAIKDSFEEMHDVSSQLIAKWARIGPDQEIDVTGDMTRLTLDSIALCAMDMRFNSFYREDLHEFVRAMNDMLVESSRRTTRTKLGALLNPGAEKKYFKDIATMKRVAQECIDRRKGAPRKKDLLDMMLYGKDPATGLPLTEETVINNMLTFLVAGHETTSGLLSFTIYYLLKNPEALHKAQQEIDTVIGSAPVEFKHMSKLPYIEAVLREALRLTPTAPGFTVGPKSTKEPFVLGGKYVLPGDAKVTILLTRVGRDPAVYGEDANEFRPERMLDENFKKLPAGAWKPFGNGKRGCIGRPFAWQEALLALALVLQNFNLRMADPSYELKIVESLTIKPAGFYIKARLRENIDPITLVKKLHGAPADSKVDSVASHRNGSAAPTTGGSRLTILYGSSSGTCENLAQSLASAAEARGFASAVSQLDGAVANLPKDHPVVVVSCTYEGEPPENAKIFMQWLKTVDPAKISGVKFAVFGCGHKDWVSTYQKVPRAIAQILTDKGATALVERGETDVSHGTIFDDFDGWSDNLWKILSPNAAETESQSTFEVELSTMSRASHLHYKLQNAKVLSNERVTHPDTAEKRHLTLKLPSDMRYEAGDYLAVLPQNHEQLVARVLRRFSLPWDTSMTITNGSHATIPAKQELPVSVVLAGYIELSTPATRKNKDILAQHSNVPLVDASGSVLDILERYPDVKIPFSTFLSMHPSLRLRQYSISSSPLYEPTEASITFSVIESAAHKGTATSYLKSLLPGSTLQVAVKKSSAAFHLPLDDSLPIIMAAAGTGVAPFRGFLQQRAIKAEASSGNKQIGPALLFLGSRRPDHDALFATELADWESRGIVKIFRAYSHAPHLSENCKYVQDRLWQEREEVARIFENEGARAYICGSAVVGRAIGDVAVKILVDESEKDVAEGKKEEDEGVLTEEAAREKWEKWRGERYAVDVFD